MSEELSLRFDVLDHQIVDADELPAGRVDDLDLEMDAGGTLRVTMVLTGAQALGERHKGALGRVMAAMARRLRAPTFPAGPARIPADRLERDGALLRLDVPLRDIPQLAALERWLARHVIGPLPGSGN